VRVDFKRGGGSSRHISRPRPMGGGYAGRPAGRCGAAGAVPPAVVHRPRGAERCPARTDPAVARGRRGQRELQQAVQHHPGERDPRRSARGVRQGGIAWVAPALQDAESVLDKGRPFSNRCRSSPQRILAAQLLCDVHERPTWRLPSRLGDMRAVFRSETKFVTLLETSDEKTEP